MNQKIFKIFIEDDKNPPFKYLESKYSINCAKLSQLSDDIISAAIVSANKFEEESSININNQLIHFFFDFFLCMNSGIFINDKDIASAIIDGIHFKYFGQPSQNTISTSMSCWQKKKIAF